MADDKPKILDDVKELASDTHPLTKNEKRAKKLDKATQTLEKAKAVSQFVAQGVSGDVLGSAMGAASLVAQVGGEKVAKRVAQAQQAVQLANSVKNVITQPPAILKTLSNVMSGKGGNSGLFGSDSPLPSGLQFTFKAFNLPAETFSVVAFEGEEAYSSLFTFNVSLVSSLPQIDFGSVLDYLGTLSIYQDGVLVRTFTGMVVEFEKGETGFHQTHYQIQIRPEFWRTTLRTNSRLFQQQDLKTIVGTLLAEHGITQYAFNFKYSHPVREFCVQYQETDYAFLSRLLAEEGIFFYFEFSSNQHTLILCDNADALPLGSAISYNPNLEATRRESIISQFKRVERIRVSSAQLRDYTFKKPSWNAQFGKHASDLDYQRKAYEYFEYPARFKQAERGEAFTQYRLDSLRNEAHLGEGESNATGLVIGERFTLLNHPDSQLNSPWQVIQIHHIGKQPQGAEAESGVQGATTYHNHFQFIPITQTWRPLALPKPQIFGPQMAMVVGPKGEEIFTDKFGRVKVQFLWDRYGQANDRSSCWIRVSQPWAGAGYGGMAIPRIGQEVIVSFLDGDPDQPIIIGRTYHATNLPPSPLPKGATQTIIKSQSHKSKGANELRMDDATGQEEFYLHAQRDMNTIVQHNQKTTVKQGNTEVTLEQGSYFTDIKSGQMLEKISQSKVTEANTISVKATQGKSAPGSQIYEADDSITLKVGDNASILLNNQEIQLKFGNSLIKLNSQGVFLNGSQIGLNNPGNTATAVQGAKNAAELTALQAKAAVGGGGNMAYGGEKISPVKAQQFEQPKEKVEDSQKTPEKSPLEQEKKEALISKALSQAVYDDKEPPSSLPEGVTKLTPEELETLNIREELLVDDRSGYKAAIYKKENTYFVAYRGTEIKLNDIKADMDLGVGEVNQQFKLASKLATTLQKNLPPNAKMVVTGHSLGGALASIAAAATGAKTYTFNSAGMHPAIFKELGLDTKNTNNITAFYAQNDPLSWVQDNRKLVAALLTPITPLFEVASWGLFGNSAIAGALGTLFGDNLSPAWGNRVKLPVDSGHTIESEALSKGVEGYYNQRIQGEIK